MRHRFLSTCLLLIVTTLSMQAQALRGYVFEQSTGEPLIGASVLIEGSTIGTTTDFDGMFEIASIPDGASNLVVSYIGLNSKVLSLSELTKQYQNGQDLVIRLEEDRKVLSEVVVTALGISREKKSLGYAAVDLKGDEMLGAPGADGNPISALQGKVAGLQISGNSTSMGGSNKILIRGVNSISGNNQPLFVIDGVPVEGTDFNSEETARGAGGYDYGNLLADINPDDIESMSVLKGASASALYGSRANNGVVLITTKKGKKDEGLGVAFNTSVGFEMINKLPRFQNEYGGGGSSEFEKVTINGKEYNIPEYAVDESWGPRFEGQQVLSWYDLYKWEIGGKVGDPTTSAWLPTQHDIRSFYRTGITSTNNISVSAASDLGNLRVSYTNTATRGIVPNSQLIKHAFNVAGAIKTWHNRLEVFTNVNYINHSAQGREETGYANNGLLQNYTQWWQRNIDFKQMGELYQLPDGNIATWNRVSFDDPRSAFATINNPFWIAYKNYEQDTRHRVYGNVGIKLDILSWLKFQYKTNLDFFVDKQYERVAIGTRLESKYSEAIRQQYELNHELLLTASQQVGDFSLSGMIGANFMYRHFEMLHGKTVGGLAVPDLYNLGNSIDPPHSSNSKSDKAINSAFADFNFGWRSMVYLGATIRVDHSSTLPKGKNTYVYPSVNGSFIFSELIGNKASWLNFGKLRAGWAMVGNDTDPYRIFNTYRLNTNIGEGVPGYLLTDQLNNANLKPETTLSAELGLEMQFLHNRLGFDFTYYHTRTTDLIVPFSVSSTTGYTTAITNAGAIQNQGIEFSLKATPIKVRGFEWNTTFSLAHNKNKVEKLIDNVTYYKIAEGRFVGEVGAYVGGEYGMLMGHDFVYDKDGNRMINPETGLYEITSDLQPIGTVYPKLTGGWTNTFRYRGLDINIVCSFQHGGIYHSLSYAHGVGSGQLEESAANHVRENGIVLEGVIDENGTPNTKRISAQYYFDNLREQSIRLSTFSSDYFRLREVSIGYTFPMKPTYFVRHLRLSAYGKNLALIGPDTKHFDPDIAVTSSGNIQGLEGGATPTTASFGLALNIKF